jgi:hypothetical protein
VPTPPGFPPPPVHLPRAPAPPPPPPPRCLLPQVRGKKQPLTVTKMPFVPSNYYRGP